MAHTHVQPHNFAPKRGEFATRSSTTPHVALCVFGTVRGFTDPRTLEGLRRNVIEAAPVADTFLRLRLSEVVNLAHRHHGYSGHSELGLVADAAHRLGAAALHVDSDDLPHALNTSCFCSKATSYHQGFLNRLEGMRWCHDQIVAREARARRQYDAVITMRADLRVDAPLPPLGGLPALCLGGGACADGGPRMFKDRDHLWITPRALVRRVLTGLMPKADAFCELRLHEGKPCVFGLSGAYTEGTIRVFLQQMGVPCVVSSFRNMSLAAPDGTTKPRGGGPTFFKARATCIGANASSYWAEALRPSGECRGGSVQKRDESILRESPR